MKKRLYIPLIALSSLALSGCSLFDDYFIIGSDNPSTDTANDTKDSEISTSDTKDSKVAVSKLVITSAPKTDYYKYDFLNFNAMTVQQQQLNKAGEILSSKITTDYKLKYKGSTSEIDMSNRLTDVATKTVVVSKSGYISAEFDITIKNVTNIKQNLEITSLPAKTDYFVRDIVDTSGLTVLLNTEYSADYEKSFTQVINDYTVEIEDEQTSSKTFSKKGNIKVYIKYTSKEGNNLSTFFTVTVSENTYTPQEYVDNTINREEDNATATIEITGKSSTSTTDKGYYSPSEVVNKYNISTYSGKNAAGATYIPSAGKVPLLVIPIVTPGDDSKATNANWNLIKKAFFGNSEDLHFESLHSYYYQSSFGKLDFTGAITPFYNPKEDSNNTGNFDKISSYQVTNTRSDIDITSNLAKQASKWAVKQLGLKLSDYDSNSDGYVDALWMVNLHKMDSDTVFWPFQTQVYHDSLNYKPAAGTTEIAAFGWANLDAINDMGFKYSSPSHTFDNQNCDAHILIHETGHLLGLSDYYSYSYNNDYGPMGKVDMMDNNVGDQNSYSKLLLGWITPYIVYGNATINLNSSQENGGVIVIPYDSKTYNTDSSGKVLFNAYDEYMVFDLYTPKNLNSQGYDCYDVDSLSVSGMKVLHVDNRLFDYNALSSFSGDSRFSMPYNPDIVFTYSSTGHYPLSVITNTEGANPETGYDASEYNFLETTTYNAYDEVRWISANKTKIDVGNVNYAKNSSLFRVNNNSTFSLSTYANQFVNSKLDCGKPFSAIVKIKSLTE